MATKVDIWNMALGHLGQSDRVVLDTDTTVGAKACALFWDVTLDEVLRAVAWPFATKIAALAGEAANPNAEWAKSYTRPADAVTIRKILATVRVAADKSKIPFRDAMQEAKIWTNVAGASSEYTMRVTDTTKYPADFTKCLSLLLAYNIAPQVTGGQQWKLAELAFAKYEKQIPLSAANASSDEKNEVEEVAAGTKEDLVNIALGYLGVDDEVQNITTEKSQAARAARLFYNISRDDTLRAFPWAFATKIAALATKVAGPNTDWAFSYAMPADAVYIRKLLDPAGRVPHQQARVPFKRATGALIFTDLDNAKAEYTVQNDTVTEYPADFKNCFAIKLAVRMAPRLIRDANSRKIVVEELEKRFEAALQKVVIAAVAEERDFSPETVAATEPKENICNAALTLLGLEEEIQDLETEQTREARAFRQFYADAVDEVFRAFDWPFARKTVALVASGALPIEEWLYAYDYPTEALAIRRILNGSTQRVEDEESRETFSIGYDVAGGTDRVIYTDKETAVAQYTVRVDDPLLWGADFRQCLAAFLAHKVAVKLVPGKRAEKTAESDRQYAHYRDCLIRAASMAANEEAPEQDPDSSLVRARG